MDNLCLEFKSIKWRLRNRNAMEGGIAVTSGTFVKHLYSPEGIGFWNGKRVVYTARAHVLVFTSDDVNIWTINIYETNL